MSGLAGRGTQQRQAHRARGATGGAEAERERRRARVVFLVEQAELTDVDADLEAWGGMDDGAGHADHQWWALWSAMRALMQGRFDACERLVRQAAIGREDEDPGARHAAVGAEILFVHLRREQGRSAEAEAMARDLRARHPEFLGAQVALACLLGDLGRDSQARAELGALAAGEFASVGADPGWLPQLCGLAELCALVEMDREAGFIYAQLAPHASRLAVDPTGAACYGSVSHPLGVLAHFLGRWEEAAGHFAQALVDHERAGAPVLAAHTRRQYAALLRARGRDDDWERAIDLLTGAETIYRRLGIEPLATEARTVLARSQDPAVPLPTDPFLLRHESGHWAIGSEKRVVHLPHLSGVDDVSRLVAQPGRSFHVTELWTGSTDRPPVAAPISVALDGQARAECHARLEELDAELTEAQDRHDAVRLSLARAERDFVAGELAAEPVDDDPVARVHRLVTLRLRLAIDHVAEVHPELGRHLRQSVRTGTFCAYEPAVPVTWGHMTDPA